MFRCEICKTSSKPGETQHKVVLATRIHNHPSRDDAYPSRMTMTGEKVARNDPGGRGSQIVREVNGCSRCALKVKHTVTVPANGVGLATFNMTQIAFSKEA